MVDHKTTNNITSNKNTKIIEMNGEESYIGQCTIAAIYCAQPNKDHYGTALREMASTLSITK